MNNKFKNIARRGISLILALVMMIPTGVFATTGNEWDKYKDELKSGIMKQEKVINIDFGNGIRYASEGLAIQAITEAYNKAMGEMPNYFEINIEESKQSPIIENLSGSYLLKGVRYDLTYYNDFTEINNKLSEIYTEINTKTKYHEKIRLAYDSIIENLHYKSLSTNHEILVGSDRDWNKEASGEAYAMLFSIIMDKLGYENLIITGKIKEGSTTQVHAWNLVKVQGKWYHVDSKIGDVDYFDGDREKYFLTSDDIIKEGNYYHYWEVDEDYKSIDVYDEDKFIVNEIKFILNGINTTGDEITSLRKKLGIEPETEGIKDNIETLEALEELTDTKNKFYAIKNDMELIKKKIQGYENNINVLDLMGVEAEVEYLRSLLNDLIVIANIDKELNEIEQEILARENQILAKDAKVLVEIVQSKIHGNENGDSILPEDSLSSLIEELEGDVKKAKAEVKGVRDITIKNDLEKTLDDIDLVIKALKAVNTLEGATKPSSSSINKARNAINVIAEDYVDIKNELIDRVNKVDDDIKVKAAEELVAKAENSLRKSDYDKAVTAVSKLREDSEEYDKLNIRLQDISDILKTIEAVEKAEKLMKAYKETDVKVYNQEVTTADNLYEKINEKYNGKYGDLINSLNKRIEEMETAVIAMESVEVARGQYDNYINSTTENEEDLREQLIDAINGANNYISSINDSNANLTNIKKSLNNELKVMTDRLATDIDNKKISDTISELEIGNPDESNNIVGIILSVLDTEIAEKTYEAISKLDDRIASIEPLLKEVKDKRKSSEFKERITALKDVLVATKAVVDAEESDVKTVSKKITTATKAIEKLNNTGTNYRIKDVKGLKENLEQRIFVLNKNIETEANEANARKLVDKALNSKKESDIKSAIEAVAKLEDRVGGLKENLKEDIEGLVNLLISDAKVAILTTIITIERKNNNKSVSKNFTEVQKAVSLAENIVIFANEKLSKADKYFEDKYKDSIEVLNKDIEILDNSILALNAVQQAEKSKTPPDVTIAETAIDKIYVIDEDDKFFDMKGALDKRIDDINKYLKEIEDSEQLAREAVAAAESSMKPEGTELELSDFKYEAGLVLAAKAAIKNVHDKNTRKDLESRILALETAQAAIVSFNKAKVYPIENNIKDAEASLGKVGSGYFSLIEVLNKEIAELYNNLNKSKSEAYKDADTAIINSNEVIKRLNRYIAGLIGPEELPLPEEMTSGDGDSSEGFDKDIAYGRVRVARNYLMDANDAVLKLSNSNEIKSLTSRIKSAHEYIDEVDDKIDVKEAIRLVDIVSDSVNATNSETDKDKKQRLKEEADLNIRDAKLAISRIDHKDNKEIKSTITKNLSLIEKRLMSNNDQELIETAYELVNTAANLLANAVKEDEVTDKSVEIGNAIWAANLAIVGISNDNKDAKAALQRFIDEISDLFELEKGIIANEDRIKNAREAVEVAEKYDGNNEDERYGLIRSARLRVNIIRNTDPDTKAIIDELNLRLDILEGKAGSGGSGSDGSGGNSGGGKGGSGSDKPGTTPINKIPTNPISNSKRVIGTGTAEPNWGRTKELKKSVPVTGVSYQDMEAIKAYESRLLIAELSNVLNNTQTNNTKILVRGNNISLDSKPYILDKVSNSVLLPIKLLGDELGFTVSLTESPVAYGPKRLFISGFVNGEVKSIIMDIGSNYCYINGFVVMISSSPVIQDGRAYIPVDLLIEHLGLNVSYYNDRGNIQLIIN